MPNSVQAEHRSQPAGRCRGCRRIGHRARRRPVGRGVCHQARGCRLTLLHAVPNLDWHFFSAVPPPKSTSIPDRDAVLAAAETAVRSTHPDLTIRRAVFKGAIATALTDASQSARLVVVGTGAADHGVLGGHAVRIVNRTHCPVVVWRQPVAKRTGKPLPVVVGVDESKDSTRALAEAFDVAAALHDR